MSSRKIPQTPWSQAQQDRLRQEVPKELRSLKQWVVWKVVEKTTSHGKTEYSKKPYNAKTGQPASTTNPDDWSYFETALKTYRCNSKYNGVGFVFGPQRCYTGIDLDDCRDIKTGKPSAWAGKWLKFLNSYTEVSPSGKGFKVICRARRPDEGMKNTSKCEVYDQERYFTITGRRVHGYSSVVENRQEPVALFVRKEMQHKSKDAEKKAVKFAILKKSPPMSDEEVRSICRSAKNAEKYCDLWNGKWERVAEEEGWDKRSQSEADLSLLNIISFYTQDREQLDRLFRKSKLYREKWERDDYREDTLNKALNKLSGHVYIPAPSDAECITNLTMQKSNDDKKFFHALSIDDCTQQVKALCGDWPRRCDKVLFYNGNGGSIKTMSDETELFAFLHGKAPIRWRDGHDSREVDYVHRGVFYKHLAATVTNYKSIEDMPHVPEHPGSYYAWCPPEKYTATGEYLQKLLNFFDNPATASDRILIKAMFLTPAWGGPCGKRPAFVVTSKDRGYGKSTLADTVGLLYGDAIEYSPSVKAEERFLSRIFSAKGLTKRIVRLDNLADKYGSGLMESLVTTRTISGYQLYEGNGERPNTLTFICTGTAVKLSRDLADRAFFIELLRPTRKSGWDNAVTEFVEQNRNYILADIVAELKKHSRRVKSSSRWLTWIEQVLSLVTNEEELSSILSQNESRQESHDEELEDAEMIRGAVFAHLQNEGLEDEKEAFIESQEMVRILRLALGENLTSRAAKARIEKHIGTHQLRGIQWFRKMHSRGFKIYSVSDFSEGKRAKADKKVAEKEHDGMSCMTHSRSYTAGQSNTPKTGSKQASTAPKGLRTVIRHIRHSVMPILGSKLDHFQHLWTRAKVRTTPEQERALRRRHVRHANKTRCSVDTE